MRRPTLAALTVVAILAAGCGATTNTPSQQIRHVVNHYTVALGENNLAAACPLTTGPIHTACRTLQNTGGLTTLTTLCTQATGHDCPQAITNAKATASWTISKIVTSGQTATVAFVGTTIVMRLQKQHGAWRITGEQ